MALAGRSTDAQRLGETCFGKPATIVSDKGIVTGTDGRDVIVAPRAGIVEAKGGNDRVCSGGFEVYGGTGDDRILTGEGGQSIYGGLGDDRVSSGPGRDLITDTEGGGDDRYDGGSDRDTLRFSVEGGSRGAKGGVVVDLEAGKSRGSRGRDRVSGVDSLVGTFDSDVIRGTPGANVLDGVRGSGDTILGREGDDVIRGATRIFGEGGGSGDPPGDDPLLSGGTGDDVIVGGYGADRLAGGEGNDSLTGGAQDDRGDGGPGKDRCEGIEAARACERGQSPAV